MIFLIVPLVIIAGMLGGQINKIIRPIVIPLIISGLWLLFKYYPWWGCLPSLLYGGILTLGYGNNSKLMKLLKSDEIVRIVYSLICCIPIIIISLILQHYISIIGCIAVIGSFQIRMGSWGKIGKYDILPVDLFRSLSISLAIIWALL